MSKVMGKAIGKPSSSKINKVAMATKVKDATDGCSLSPMARKEWLIPHDYEKQMTVTEAELGEDNAIFECELDGIQVAVNPEEDQFNSSVDSDLDYDDTELNETTTTPKRVPTPPKLSSNEKAQQSLDSESERMNKMKKLRAELQADPDVQQLVNELVQENVQKEMSLHKRSQESIGETPKRSKDKGNKVRSTPKRRLCDRIVKSPSDTTLYTPALKKEMETNNVIDRISDFVETIRIQDQHAREWPSTSRRQQPPDVNNINSQRPSPVQVEHDVAEQMILDAEHFKGNVTAPKGNELITQVEPIGGLYNGLPHLPPEIEMLCRNDNDDDFFHITCHIDPSLRLKIEKGEYVELDRLLAKDNNTRTLNEDKRIELVSRGGATFFAPVQD